MPRHEWWRREYRKERYLELVSSEDLQEHFRDLFNCTVTLTPESKIGPRDDRFAMDVLWPKFTHVLEEYSLRGEPYLQYGLMRNHSLPSLMYPRRGRHRQGEAKGWRGVIRPLPKGAIVKYGKLEHLLPLLERGCVRLWPASRYHDMRLDAHRRDDERVRTSMVHPRGMKVRLVQHRDGTKVVDAPEVEPIGNVTFFTESPDYYVWCASYALEPRLFVDFNADACLIIRQPEEFAKRLGFMLTDHVGRTCLPLRSVDLETGRIAYYDPYRPPDIPGSPQRPSDNRLIRTPRGTCLNVPWVKPIRYAYQREWRAVLMPIPIRKGELPELHLTLGPLSDIAEIVYVGELDGRPLQIQRTAIVPLPI